MVNKNSAMIEVQESQGSSAVDGAVDINNNNRIQPQKKCAC